MVLRGLLANFILTDIITFMFMLFLPKQYYLYAVLGIETLQYLYVVRKMGNDCMDQINWLNLFEPVY